MLVRYAKRLLRGIAPGRAADDRASRRSGKTETTMISMLSINNIVGRQSARNACSPLSLQTSILVFVAMLLTVAAPVFGQSPNTDASPASSSPASTPSTLAPSTYSSCHVDGPYIAMTFDDGPSVGNTTRLLDILKQRNIKVTFFMIGPNVVAHPEIARRALAEGHEIGNHSWTHPQSLSGKWPWGNAFASWGIIAGYDLGTLSD